MSQSLRLACTALVLAGLQTACAAPGSALRTLSFKGEMKTALGEPLPGRPVRLAIPAEYGLGGLDRFFGGPQAYGHRDQFLEATTEPDGSFAVGHGPVVYHIGFWLLPPLGPRPRYPPAPTFFAILPDAPNEVYRIHVDGRRVRYHVFDRQSRARIPAERATWAIVSGLTRRTNSGGHRGLEITLFARRAT
jgi:hypothetical protein